MSRHFLYSAFLAGFSARALAADSCYPRFTGPMDKAVQWVAQDCKAIQAEEPGECQRAVGARCQSSYDELLRVRGDVCTNLAGDKVFLESRQHAAGVDAQKAAQDASGALAADTAAVSDGLAAFLIKARDRLAGHMRENEAVLRLGVCARSSQLPSYSGRVKSLNEHVSVAKELLDAFSKKKKRDAARAGAASAGAEQRAQALSSATPMLAGDTYDGEGRKLKRWVVPALVGSAALLGTYALLRKKDKGAPAPPAETPELKPDSAPPPGAGGPPSPALPEPSSPGPSPAPAEPGSSFQHNGIRVDPAFSDADRRDIARAVQLFPECQRRFLVGVVVRSNPNLRWRDGRGCLPGKNSSMSPPTVELNTRCRTGMGNHTALLVHELMHVLANRRGYYQRYAAVFRRHPGCGVSLYSHGIYGGRNLNEDFAEAGRWAIYPSSAGFYSGGCVTPKLEEARRIIQDCR